MTIHPITKVRRLLAAALALMAASVMMCSTALATEFVSANEISPNGGTGTIVVTVYDQDPSSSAGTGGENTELNGEPVKGVGINALRIGSVVELTTNNNGVVTTQVAFGLIQTYVDLLDLDTNNAIASNGDTYYFEPQRVQNAVTNKQTGIEDYLSTEGVNGLINEVTNDQGAATFENLSYGLYLLAKSGLPADATTDLVPFLVSVPMYVENDQSGAWQSTVYAYPKVRTDDIEISKSVNDNDKYINAGQTLRYTVTAAIPAAATGNGSANEFTSFVIADANNDGMLDINEDTIEVWLGNVLLDKGTQYSVSHTGSVLTVTLTDAETIGGLVELNKNLSDSQTITITYDATVATDVTFSTEITNTAKATYQRSGMAMTADTNEATVKLYTYGIDLTKTLSDTSDKITAGKISFELYKTYDSDTGLFEDKVPVKSGKNGYWVAASDGNPATTTMYVGAGGKLNLYGLEPGTYYLKETATMNGYALLAEPITIVISDDDNNGSATATVNGVTATVTGGLVELAVQNTKLTAGFTLPQTGGPGTIAATAVGIGLLCVAVVALVVYRKRSKN